MRVNAEANEKVVKSILDSAEIASEVSNRIADAMVRKARGEEYCSLMDRILGMEDRIINLEGWTIKKIYESVEVENEELMKVSEEDIFMLSSISTEKQLEDLKDISRISHRNIVEIVEEEISRAEAIAFFRDKTFTFASIDHEVTYSSNFDSRSPEHIRQHEKVEAMGVDANLYHIQDRYRILPGRIKFFHNYNFRVNKAMLEVNIMGKTYELCNVIAYPIVAGDFFHPKGKRPDITIPYLEIYGDNEFIKDDIIKSLKSAPMDIAKKVEASRISEFISEVNSEIALNNLRKLYAGLTELYRKIRTN